ncbi:hypothetical protein [Mucilaginibacter terrae]|uniref:Rhamnosyltransferase n=1 Tax=Mucilaginibacter terrae TaxID=1955052 RepID=A0ABU3GQL4_9SPHI|nr:hypothetical protein [Mucilaginibacter terrae]MDT3401766.1 rhamnosyltransferase [Mucilaginibacter terrae]
MNVSVVVIFFKSKEEDFARNINTYIHEVDHVIIWQNSLLDKRILSLIDKAQVHKIVIAGTGENVGIGRALNESIRILRNLGATHIMTMDQDSHFIAGHLSEYKKLIKLHSSLDIGVFGINPNNWGRLLYPENDIFIEVTDTITSGSIFPIHVFDEFGVFDEKLFIDAVDYEFCYRLKTRGIKTIVFPSVHLEHQVGEMYKTWLGFKTDNYSAFRTYFLVRNHITMWKLYPSIFPARYKVMLVKGHIMYRLVKIVLGEKDKLNKITSIFRGIFDGFKGA